MSRINKGHDAWFYQLLDMADGGDECAIQDLWLTYEYDFTKHGRGEL